MKFDMLRETNRELFDYVRHDYGRKISEWSEAEDRISLDQAQIDALGVYDVPEGIGPMDVLPKEFADSIFVAYVNKKLYVVNTEGYNYCRYVAKVKLVGVKPYTV